MPSKKSNCVQTNLCFINSDLSNQNCKQALSTIPQFSNLIECVSSKPSPKKRKQELNQMLFFIRTRRQQLAKLSLSQLQQLAMFYKIPNRSKMNRNQLISVLKNKLQ